MNLSNFILIWACVLAVVYGCKFILLTCSTPFVYLLEYLGCDPWQFQCEPGYTGCENNDCRCLLGWRSTFPVSNSCEPSTSFENKMIERSNTHI